MHFSEMVTHAETDELTELMKLFQNAEALSVYQEELLRSIQTELKKRSDIPQDSKINIDSTQILRKIALSGTVEDLLVILDKLMHSNDVVREEVHLIYDITDELRKKGVRVPYSDGQLWKRYANLVKTSVPLKNMFQKQDEERAKRNERAFIREIRRYRAVLACKYVAIVLAALMVLNIAAYAAGFDLFGLVSNVTKTALQFVRPNSEETEHVANNEFRVLSDTLHSLGYDIDLPAYLPDGFSFGFISPEEPSADASVIAWFNNGDKHMSLKITPISLAENTYYEANVDETPELYREKYTIYRNLERYAAFWLQENCEIRIHGDITYNQLTQILDSIER